VTGTRAASPWQHRRDIARQKIVRKKDRMFMNASEPRNEEPRPPTKPEPIQEIHAAVMWRETQQLEAKLNEVIRAVNWLLSHT
jgi:hypothetical protein